MNNTNLKYLAWKCKYEERYIEKDLKNAIIKFQCPFDIGQSNSDQSRISPLINYNFANKSFLCYINVSSIFENTDIFLKLNNDDKIPVSILFCLNVVSNYYNEKELSPVTELHILKNASIFYNIIYEKMPNVIEVIDVIYDTKDEEHKVVIYDNEINDFKCISLFHVLFTTDLYYQHIESNKHINLNNMLNNKES